MSRRRIAVPGRPESGSIASAGSGDDNDGSDASSKGGELGEKLDSVPLKIETFDNRVESSESVESVSSSVDAVIAIELDELKREGSADIQVRDDSSHVSEEKRDLDECSVSVSPTLDEVENDHDPEKGMMNTAPFDDDVGEKTGLDYVDVGGDDKGITETEELVNVSGSVEEGIRNEVDDGGGGDDCSSIGDVYELVEEKLEELESRVAANNRVEKKSECSKKALELAEELEKKHASTGLHFEEGAAAQPMRLEGVRRGSTTLGYFNVDADNAVTRAISSQTFRREHGSAQVLAVHANYIAVGMTKGLIVVVPSKYSVHHADNTDGKVVDSIKLYKLFKYNVCREKYLQLI